MLAVCDSWSLTKWDLHVLQTLYNHTTPRIICQLLSQWHAQLGGHPNPGDPSAADAAEVVADAADMGDSTHGSAELSSNLLENKKGGSTQQRAAPALAHDAATRQQQGATSILQHAGGAVLLQVPVTECGGCATFGALFGWLLGERGMVAAALYRQAQHQGSTLHYVYNNPDQVRQVLLRTAGLMRASSTADILHDVLWQQCYTGDSRSVNAACKQHTLGRSPYSPFLPSHKRTHAPCFCIST
jgi:hypothetical protein